MTTGQKITERRKLLSLSQEKLGEQVGVTRQAISKWEADATLPEVEKLAALSKLFGVSVGWLLGLEESTVNSQPVERSDFSEEQLKMLEDIVKRYAPPPPPPQPKKKPYWVMGLTALCLVLAIGLGILAGSFIHWRNQMQLQMTDVTTGVQGIRDNINTLNSFDYDGLYSQIESQIDEMVGRKSVLATYGLDVLKYDMEQSTVTLRLTAVPIFPKLITSESDLQFTAMVDGKTCTADSLTWDGSSIMGEISVPLKNGCYVYLSLPTENGQQQLCLNNEGDSCYNLKSNGSFSFEQWGFDQCHVSKDLDDKSFVLNWNLDEYAYLEIGEYEYYLAATGDGESTPYDTYGLEMTLEVYYNDAIYHITPVSLNDGDAPHGTLKLPENPKMGDTITYHIFANLNDGRTTDYTLSMENHFDGKLWDSF